MRIVKILLIFSIICIVAMLIFWFGSVLFTSDIKSKIIELSLLFVAEMDYQYYIAVLGLVGVLTIVIFIFTRLFLGRQVESHGDFWEHQNLAKSKVFWLNTLFFMMLFLIFVTSFCMFQIVFLLFDEDIDYLHIKISMMLSFVIIIITGIAYLVMDVKIRKNGINALAKSLEATEIFPSTQDSDEKQLLDIIEEMAIASNMPMPRVFIMQNEINVNAMCSGENFGKFNEKIAIFVTKGALREFSKEEMQGVIGHEFSHAFHGDISLNIRIVSLIFALTFITIIGKAFIKNAISNSNKSNSKDNKGGALVIISLAAIVYAIGGLGVFFASVIQSAISRQKEFLADASSVQYTRNVNGIKSALKKLKSLQDKRIDNVSAINNQKARYCSHMFFLSAFDGIFATHPRLEKRIEALNNIG